MIDSKQQAMNLFEQRRKEFLEYARWVAKRIYKQKGSVTIDDVREVCLLPDGINPKVYGAVFNSEDWEKAGYTSTRRETSHGRMIAIWRLVTPYREEYKPNYYTFEPRQMELI